MITKRQFLQAALALILGANSLACGKTENLSPARADLLRGNPLETLKVRGYRGLADLPFFELGERGKLRLVLDDLPPAVDFHTHLAFNMFLAPRVDLLRETPAVHYLIDCDGAEPPCVLDLDVYMNHIADKAMLDKMEAEVRGMLLLGSRAAHTYTIPNLLAEMDSVHFEKAVLLPIAPGLLLRDDLTRWWLEAVRRSGAADRFIPFGSVRPTRDDAVERLRELTKLGIAGVKLHPTMQRFYPDGPGAMKVYAACAEMNLPVFFHAGRAGIEPEFTRDYAVMKHYIAPVAEFPNVRFVFGHSGARDFRDALPIAKTHRNVWMDVQGQGVTTLREMIKVLGPEQLVFGSDWPWYPLAATLAKVLIATAGDKTTRNMILADNAQRLLHA